MREEARRERRSRGSRARWKPSTESTSSSGWGGETKALEEADQAHRVTDWEQLGGAGQAQPCRTGAARHEVCRLPPHRGREAVGTKPQEADVPQHSRRRKTQPPPAGDPRPGTCTTLSGNPVGAPATVLHSIPFHLGPYWVLGLSGSALWAGGCQGLSQCSTQGRGAHSTGGWSGARPPSYVHQPLGLDGPRRSGGNAAGSMRPAAWAGTSLAARRSTDMCRTGHQQHVADKLRNEC